MDFLALMIAEMSHAGEEVNLPHDFMIHTDVTPATAGGRNSGFYRGECVTYVKKLFVEESWREQEVILEFDGSYMNTEVSVNGHFVTLHHYGYTPFHANLTPFLQYGQENRIVVTVNNSAPDNSRWYSGTRLYRHVDLLIGPKAHLAPWSIFAYTESIQQQDAVVVAEITVRNTTTSPCKKRVQVSISDERTPEQAVAFAETSVWVESRGEAVAKVRLLVKDAHLWDLQDPYLYQVTAALFSENQEQADDVDQTTFGIRTISIDREHGFRLNGRTIKLKGGCVHHDHGILGAASFYDSELRKFRLHKAHGYNAIRCAHNPPSRDMLTVCDRLGLLVINEAFDVWEMKKNSNDYHLYFRSDWKDDLKAFMLRDRNHPCIIMWSIGNEIVERNGLSNGYRLAAELAAYARTLDHSRFLISAIPVPFNGLEDADMAKSLASLQQYLAETGGSYQNMDNPYILGILAEKTEAFAAPLDVVGYNYLDQKYAEDGARYPSRIICGTESHGKRADIVWAEVNKFPYVIGDFAWVSMDYLGEAGGGITVYLDEAELRAAQANPNAYGIPFPYRTNNGSDFDLCGEERTQLHFRKIVWGSEETWIAVQPPRHFGKIEYVSAWGFPEAYAEWDYPDDIGKPVNIDVFSAAEEVELFMNGNSLGRKSAGKGNHFQARYAATYEPGRIEAVSYASGREVSRQILESPGMAQRVQIHLENDALAADGQALCFARIVVTDQDGKRVSNKDWKARASVSGAATLAAFGTGRPITEENYTTGEFTSYHGQWLAVVRAGLAPGQATLRVEVDGLGAAEAVIAEA